MPSSAPAPFDSVEAAIQDIADGRMIIVTDDENRENEGDLVMAASKATPEAVNTMIRHARGLICVPTTGACTHSPVTLDLDSDGHRAPLPGHQAGDTGACGDDCDDTNASAVPGGRGIASPGRGGAFR